MGNRAITGCSRSWFFSYSSVASSKTGRSEYDNLFPRGASPSAEASPRGKPFGHEVGISLRPITLLLDEKEQ